jgi:hypothetical protein
MKTKQELKSELDTYKEILKEEKKAELQHKAEKKIQNQKNQLNPQFQYKKALNKYEVNRLKNYSKNRVIYNKKTNIQKVAYQQAQANRRSNIIGNLYNRAESMEMWAVNLDEVPLLNAMETTRQNMTSPPNRRMTEIIDSTAFSFPD